MDTKLRDAYFAGLIGGDGSICLVSNGQKHKSTGAMIQLGMTCEKTVKAIKEFYGVGSIRIEDARSKTILRDGREITGYKPIFKWKATYKKARYVIERIYPFLITKKENAEICLAHVKSKPGPKPKSRP